jgi:two-component system, OmpR family, phosphate regulon sensor histidine kinase PhoR
VYNKHKMYWGGKNLKPRSARIIRYAGLLIPSLIVFYGVLIQNGAIYSPYRVDSFGFLAFSLLWLFISAFQFIYPSKSRVDSGLRLISFHLIFGAYLIFITGLFSPISIFWVILSLISYIYFSKIGFWLNILAFIVVVWASAFIWNPSYELNPIYYLLVLCVVCVASYILMTISRSIQISRNELLESKAQESLQRDRFTTIVNNLTDAVLSTDKDGIVKIYNAASLNLLDTNVSLNGKHIDEILPLIDLDGKDFSIFKELKAAKTVEKRDDLTYAFDADDTIRLEITLSPIRSGYSRSKKSETHDGYIIIMRDITKAKSLEEERDEFISVISHELRTPITIAEGTISNLQIMMKHPDATKKMLTDAVGLAHEQIVFLASMVNDLSTLSRAERGVADNAEDIDIRDLANSLHNKYSDAAKAKKLHLNLDLSGRIDHVYVSKLYLEELIQNLVTNAIKYTKKGSVTIIIKQKADIITFAVKDTGIGISKSDQQKVFSKFYRSEDYRTRESSGTGLGLYVAQKLAHKIGTKIILKSRLNFGSTFSISLPSKKG